MLMFLVKEVLADVDVGKAYSPPFTDLGSLVTTILVNGFYLAGFIFLLILIFAGFQLIMGAGSSNSEQTEKGMKALRSSLLGFGIVIAVYLIVQIMEAVTGVNILSPNGLFR